ncbi:hypothetical protein WICMUC_004231 [Wickerhamomyces mucosus]|uniref:Very long-chain fatty acid transport protein n=1 Tax=Wickerhamomyces mucosus TaxID=1378264 RepID=A0A9P8TBH0_9ASCO|nr:hypothetical protein WICMUC_004231 [Wickerhamomyces mucosus]
MEYARNCLSRFNEKHQITEDIDIIAYVLKRVAITVNNALKGNHSYWYLFESIAKKYPNNNGLIFVKPTSEYFSLESYTFQEIYDIVLRLSFILVDKYGLKSGDTVALDFTNKPLFIFLWFSCWNIGVAPAFLNYNVVGDPLIHCVKEAEATSLFVDPKVADQVRPYEKELSKITNVNYINEDELLLLIKNPSSPKFRQDNDLRNKYNATDYSTAALIYTSGTTGLPKPAIMSWRKAGLGASLYTKIVKITPESIVYTSMPLYHSTAAILGLCTTWLAGGCIALSVKFSVSTIWNQIKLCQATHLQYVGEVCRYLLNSKPHPLERDHNLQIAYGNGLRADIWKEFKSRFNIEAVGEFYAATESPIALTSFQTGDIGIGSCRKYGTIISQILSYQQAIIRMDPDDSSQVYRNAKGLCEVTKPGEQGELIMNLFFAKKPERAFQGYKNNTKETNSKILRNVFRKGDAWFRSGDLLKKDESDHWYFVDRMGDTFRWKSENVSTNEVELILSNNIDSIKEVVVVGVKINGYEGRAGYAIIQQSNDRIKETLKEIATCKLLTSYAKPIFVKFVPEIKHTDNFKLLKTHYKNEKFPKGENDDQVIYWLNGKEYQELTEVDWEKIISGKARI